MTVSAQPTAKSDYPSQNPVIVTNGLCKEYGSFKAIKGISFEVSPGEIFGLIGPDGAGKTSTFHILGGVMEPSSGLVEILGEKPSQARLSIGYLTQQFSLHLDLSIDENLRYTAGLREIPSNLFEERRAKYLGLMGLAQFGGRLAGHLSGGMKQKLALCCALVSRPKILLLDEPTTGVDPVSRREFWDILASVSSEGVTVAVATPYLDEAERCHRVALMYEGTIRQIGTPRALIQSLHLHRLEVRCNRLETLERTLSELKSKSQAIKDVQEFGDRLDVLVPDVSQGEAIIEEVAARSGLENIRIEPHEANLENVFVLSLKSEQDTIGEEKPFAFSRQNNSFNRQTVAIGAQQISMRFGDFQAVKDVSLEVRYGQIYGLLGANGAGKTTTIKMLCGLLHPSAGKMILAGETSDLRSPGLRQRIGYMSQKFTLYDDLSIIENLEFYCGVYEVPRRRRPEKIDWVLKTCGLEGQENLITGSLPGGWKQRVSFGASVMHEPEILFLDEPTSGVDPLARRQLWKIIREFARNGTAILVTTHFLEEAEHCHKLGFMVNGQLVHQGAPGEIKAQQPGQLFEIVSSNSRATCDLLKEHFDSWRVAIFANTVHLVLDRPEQELPQVTDLLEKKGIALSQCQPIPFSLEDAFISIVQRAGKAS